MNQYLGSIELIAMKKTAIVTGAAQGIGLAITQHFLSRGWQVGMVDRDIDALEESSSKLKEVLALPYDISMPEQVEKMMQETLAHFGRVDALINNAGIAEFKNLDDTDFKCWREIMATNLDGTFLCSKAVIPSLKEAQGAIVNIASISGLRASTLRVAYGTSKAAIIHLTKQLAIELGDYKIRVNCIAPGPVKTKLAESVHAPEIVTAYFDVMPISRYGTTEEIAEVVYFLCSEKSSFITGHTIAVDGGFGATGVGLPALRK